MFSTRKARVLTLPCDRAVGNVFRKMIFIYVRYI